MNRVAGFRQGGHRVVAYDPGSGLITQAKEKWVAPLKSLLLEFAAGALKQDHRLASLQGYVQDSGECLRMLKDGPVHTFTTALFTRFRSRQAESFAEKMLAVLRNAFEGHAIHRKPGNLRFLCPLPTPRLLLSP